MVPVFENLLTFSFYRLSVQHHTKNDCFPVGEEPAKTDIHEDGVIKVSISNYLEAFKCRLEEKRKEVLKK